jgi:hypothetical protein
MKNDSILERIDNEKSKFIESDSSSIVETAFIRINRVKGRTLNMLCTHAFYAVSYSSYTLE